MTECDNLIPRGGIGCTLKACSWIVERKDLFASLLSDRGSNQFHFNLVIRRQYSCNVLFCAVREQNAQNIVFPLQGVMVNTPLNPRLALNRLRTRQVKIEKHPLVMLCVAYVVLFRLLYSCLVGVMQGVPPPFRGSPPPLLPPTLTR